MTLFSNLKIEPSLLSKLDQLGFKTATSIQEKVIPAMVEGSDVLATAPTGTGKTLAFLLPLLTKLIQKKVHSALILTPTRELAFQISAELKKLNNQFKTALLIGGDPFFKQLKALKTNPKIIIGTPGRVADHIERGKLHVTQTNYLVLDETDRMLDMGFSTQINPIIELMPKERQTVLFSATLPLKLRQIAKKYLQNPKEISTGTLNAPAKKIKQNTTHLEGKDKFTYLYQLLKDQTGTKIVFVGTKRSCEQITQKLHKQSIKAETLHGDLSQHKRRKVTQAFHQKKFHVLVATDVAARGLDIPHVAHVVNFDLPFNPEDYIHRIGRTARADQEGSAWNLVNEQDQGKWKAIERFIQSQGEDHVQAKKTKRRPSFKKKRHFDQLQSDQTNKRKKWTPKHQNKKSHGEPTKPFKKKFKPKSNSAKSNRKTHSVA